MNARGHGLGLYICKKICESLGGEFTVESTLHVGSKFTASVNAYSVQPCENRGSTPLFNISENHKSSLGSLHGPEDTASLSRYKIEDGNSEDN